MNEREAESRQCAIRSMHFVSNVVWWFRQIVLWSKPERLIVHVKCLTPIVDASRPKCEFCNKIPIWKSRRPADTNERTNEKWEICLALLHNLVHHFCSQQIFAFVQFRRAFRCVYLIWWSCTSSSSCTFYSGTKLTFTMTCQWRRRALTVPDFCQTSQAPEIFRKMHFWRSGSVGSTAMSYVTALTAQYLQQSISISIHLLILRVSVLRWIRCNGSSSRRCVCGLTRAAYEDRNVFRSTSGPKCSVYLVVCACASNVTFDNCFSIYSICVVSMWPVSCFGGLATCLWLNFNCLSSSNLCERRTVCSLLLNVVMDSLHPLQICLQLKRYEAPVRLQKTFSTRDVICVASRDNVQSSE